MRIGQHLSERAHQQVAFKLKVAESFLVGDGGAKLLAQRWSVAEEKIRALGGKPWRQP